MLTNINSIVTAIYGIVAIFISYTLLNALLSIFENQRNNFTRHAGVTLADLFIFLDPTRVWWMAIAFTLVASFLATIFTESWVMGSMAGIVAMFLPRKFLAFLRARREQKNMTTLGEGGVLCVRDLAWHRLWSYWSAKPKERCRKNLI
jgi:tight adherence protein B